MSRELLRLKLPSGTMILVGKAKRGRTERHEEVALLLSNAHESCGALLTVAEAQRVIEALLEATRR